MKILQQPVLNNNDFQNSSSIIEEQQLTHLLPEKYARLGSGTENTEQSK